MSSTQSLPIAWRVRDRLFPVLTAGFAFIWAWGAMYVADYVGTMNSARVIGALMTTSMSPGTSMPSFPSGLFNLPPSTVPASPAIQQQQLKRQIATVEVVVYVWRWGMVAVAALLELMAIAAAISGRVRRWHLWAALLILASTAGTLGALWMLTHPQWGGMPPLPQLTHVCTAAVQSVYGFILLIAFAFRPRGS